MSPDAPPAAAAEDPQAAAEGAREAAKRATRRALIEAGLAEFAERGLDVPSLDAICARAGFTRGAFYVHFADRTEFVVAVMEHVLGAFLDATIAVEEHERGVEHTISRYVEALKHDPLLRDGGPGGGLPFHRILEACARSPRIRAGFGQLLREAIERLSKAAGEGQLAGTVRGDIDGEQLATLLVALSLGAVTALESGLELDLESARDAVLSLVRG